VLPPTPSASEGGGRYHPGSGPARRRLREEASPPMHYDAHQPVIDDLEARILTIRDSL